MEATKRAEVESAAGGAEADGERQTAELFLISLFMNPRTFGLNLIMSKFWKLVFYTCYLLIPF